MLPCSLVVGFWLDEFEFGLHVVEEFLLGFKLRLGFVDELFWRLLYVVWIAEASFERVDFLAELEDAILEVLLVLSVNFFWYLEIDVWVTGDSEVETLGVFWLDLWDAWSLGVVLKKKLDFVDELIVVESDWIAASAWEALEVASDVRHDKYKLFELLGPCGVKWKLLWPFLRDAHTLSPAERLPNGFSNEWREWVEHDENLLERGL